MEGQLFDKSMTELREAFVRARFAQADVFGRADITEWLERRFAINDHSALGREWEKPTWRKHFVGGPNTGSLREILASHVSNDRHQILVVEPRHRAALAVVAALETAGHAVYYDCWRQFAIVEADESTLVTITFSTAQPCSINRPTTAEDVLNAVHGEYASTRRRCIAALTWLKEQYTAAIQSVRADAERDFDEAVAVSGDGTKIVKAEWVIVVPSKLDSRWLLFPHSAFVGAKIRRQPDIDGPRLYGYRSHKTRCDELLYYNDLSPQDHGCAGSALMNLSPQRLETQRARHINQPQWSLEMTDVAGFPSIGSILFVEAHDCPSPLPEGGRVIRR